MTAEQVCLSCEYEAEWVATGQWRNDQARNHWMMWGCTCDWEKTANEVQAYMEVIS